MLVITPTNRFKKSVKLCKKRGYDLRKIEQIITRLQADGEPPIKSNPHKLSGNHAGEWECHIEPDWLLVYLIDNETLTLLDTGTHSDLF